MFIKMLLILLVMVVVSISLNDEILQEIDRIQHELGFSGRSEVIRAGARSLILESRENQQLTGSINAVLLIVHAHDADSIVSDIKHLFEDIMKTQIHSHLRENTCLDIFVLDGDATYIKSMVRKFQTNRKIDYVKLIVA